MLRTISMGLQAASGARISVKDAAKKLGISRQRVRFLLKSGRLEGVKDARDIWHVSWPAHFFFGSRGPSVRWRQPSNAAVWSLSRREAIVDIAPDRQGRKTLP